MTASRVHQAPLQPADVESRSRRVVGRTIECLAEIDSTNRHLLDHAVERPDGAVVSAEYQTQGRGRLGRQWAAPRGSSILLSMLWKPACEDALRFGTLLAAVATCEVVAAVTRLAPRVRWPNDLTLTDRKFAGVLAESRALPNGGRALVIGIGINVWQQRAHFPPELCEKATALEIESTQPVDRTAVARRLLDQLDEERWSFAAEGGPARLLARWRALCDDCGRPATLSADGRQFRGVIREIAADGDLLVELPDGTRRRFGAATTTRSW